MGRCPLPLRYRRSRFRRALAALAKLLGLLFVLPAFVTHRQLSGVLWARSSAADVDEMVVLTMATSAASGGGPSWSFLPVAGAAASIRGKGGIMTSPSFSQEDVDPSGIYFRLRAVATPYEAPSYRRARNLPPPGDALRVADWVQETATLRAVRRVEDSNSEWALRPATGKEPWALVRRHDGSETVVAMAKVGSSMCGPYHAILMTETDATKLSSRVMARVTCGPTPSESPATTAAGEPSEIYELLTKTPATALLIGFNCILWFLYWNNRIDPAAVAMSYSSIVRHGEAWRALSGATAHFEPWHLLFNMTALYGLGRELEGRLYSSVAFLLWNLSLLALTALVWCGLHTLRRGLAARARRAAPGESEDRWTVGYSGVLFAWIVAASLRQAETCPVFFLPGICFRTFRIAGKIPFSFAPLVQLTVAQVVLPRVSFLGHLAGLLVGFLMHWGLLPIAIVQPAICIPLVYLLYLRYIRKAVPPVGALWRNVLMARGQRIDESLQRALLVVLLFSSLLFIGQYSASSATLLLPSLIALHFWIASADNTSPIEGSDQALMRQDTLLRSFIVVSVLTLVNDSMALGAWFVIPVRWTVSLVLLSLARSVILLAGVCRACQQIQVPALGIFWNCLGWTTLEPCRELGELLNQDGHESIYLTDSSADSDGERTGEWAPFTGQGRVLGTSGSVLELLQQDVIARAG